MVFSTMLKPVLINSAANHGVWQAADDKLNHKLFRQQALLEALPANAELNGTIIVR